MKHSWLQAIPFALQLIFAACLTIVVFLIAITFGAADTTLSDVYHALFTTVSNDKITMLEEIRIPRAVAAMLVGGALAIAGAIMQGTTRNPLADPGLLGLSAGANLALAISIVLLPTISTLTTVWVCFIGAGIAVLLVIGIGSAKRGGFSPLRIVLAGAAITAFLNAITEGIGLHFQITKRVSMWTSGGLIGTTWSQISMISPFIIVGIIVALYYSRSLTLLSLDEEAATGLGQNVTKVKIILFTVVVILAGSSVALVGNMAFIGLMIPHIVRAVVGNDYRYILPMSIFIGSTFMVLADLLGRIVTAPYEAPAAAIVAIMGLPFFLLVVRKGGRNF
ncbi:MAG: iron ABC transporter permease [Candidatus Pristimantibacillus lignocellulolyticus]|uniref:Iron ABC transporter permease n=1 Tax=Candidatus Pristimantibacillus lignocellulolyticus TaxID=2994561 RepID=A0A9J6ZL54_9BACL|nr:MAG: iron ABC transporter permease [Candidatus Pristimantibacillus lignocellulolyticus]